MYKNVIINLKNDYFYFTTVVQTVLFVSLLTFINALLPMYSYKSYTDFCLCFA
jgi:hypothetical protein